jgi:hypothetical protein
MESMIEKISLACLGIVALYVFFNAQQAGSVISQIGQNTGGLFGVLQGGTVSFPGATGMGGQGVQITRAAF